MYVHMEHSGLTVGCFWGNPGHPCSCFGVCHLSDNYATLTRTLFPQMRKCGTVQRKLRYRGESKGSRETPRFWSVTMWDHRAVMIQYFEPDFEFANSLTVMNRACVSETVRGWLGSFYALGYSDNSRVRVRVEASLRSGYCRQSKDKSNRSSFVTIPPLNAIFNSIAFYNFDVAQVLVRPGFDQGSSAVSERRTRRNGNLIWQLASSSIRFIEFSSGDWKENTLFQLYRRHPSYLPILEKRCVQMHNRGHQTNQTNERGRSINCPESSRCLSSGTWFVRPMD